MEPQRVTALHAFAERFASEELLHGERGRELDDVGESELAQPLVVVDEVRLVAVEDLERLLGVALRGGSYSFRREARAAFELVADVTDLRGERADEEGDVVAEVLEELQLAHRDRVPDVQIGARRVVAHV